MKKVVVIALAVIFSISLFGCVANTEHDKLLQEKVRAEKMLEDLAAKEVGLKNEITERQAEVKGLRGDLKEAKSELSNARSQIKDLNNKLDKLMREEKTAEE